MEEKNKSHKLNEYSAGKTRQNSSIVAEKRGDATPWVITGIVVVIVIIGVTVWANSMNSNTIIPPTTENNTALINPPTTGDNTGSTTPTAPEMYQFAVNDFGYYSGSAMMPALTVNSGQPLELDLMVMQSGIAGDGLEFRGCGVNSGVVTPGSTTQLSFTPMQDCMITAYTATMQPYAEGGNTLQQSSLNIMVQ